jgi:hypothetical protein
MTNGPPSRFEFDALTARIDRMDERGTSVAGGVGARLEAAERDLVALRESMTTEEDKRSANRKWLITAAVAGTATLATIASFILTYVFHLS